jgi:hypothetical protein
MGADMSNDNKKDLLGNAVNTVKRVAGEALQKGAETAATVVAMRAAEGAADMLQPEKPRQQKRKKKAVMRSAPKRKKTAAKKSNPKKTAKRKNANKTSKKKRI